MIDQARSQVFTIVMSPSQAVTGAQSLSVEQITGRQISIWPAGHIVDKKYRIESLIGHGGMGLVYRAHHLHLDKDVAIKTIHNYGSEETNSEVWTQFQKEARILATLNHPNIVRIFDLGFSEEKVPFFSMELLEGESLAEKLEKDGALDQALACAIFEQVLSGLSAAHNKGILHRDIKPGNIFLQTLPSTSVQSGQNFAVKILDFGIAGLSVDEDENTTSVQADTGGRCFGSPLYMSPEQAVSSKLSAASDIYSVACTMFESLTGQAPFRGENALATFVMHHSTPAPRLSRFVDKQVPMRLEHLIDKALQKSPAQRFASASSMLDELKLAAGASGLISHNRADVAKYSTNTADFESGNDGARGGGAGKFVASAAIVLAFLIVGIVGQQLLFKKPVASEVTFVNAALPESDTVEEVEKPIADVDIPRYFFNRSEKDLKANVIHVTFPNGEPIGKFSTDLNEENPPRLARGSYYIPLKSTVTFLATGPVAAQPKLLDHFRADDLWSLDLRNLATSGASENTRWDDRQMPYVAKLTGLRQLQLNNSYLTKKSLPSLNALKNLDELSLISQQESVDWLTDFARLDSLKDLRFKNCRGVKTVLARLEATHGRTERLDLRECDLDDNDVAALSALKDLTVIDLGVNPKITDVGLKKLTALKKLRAITLEGVTVTAHSVSELLDLPHLVEISIPGNIFNPVEMQTLSRKYPHLHIRQGPPTDITG